MKRRAGMQATGLADPCNRWARILALALAMWISGWGCAQATYPDHPVRIVVPYTAGGPADLLARYIAGRLTQSTGQSFVVENKPGAGLVIGADAVAKADADGYTLLVNASSMLIPGQGTSRSPEDNLRDFAPVTLIGTLPMVLLVSPDLHIDNLAQLGAYASQRPGQVNYGSSGSGSLTHLSGALLASMMGLDLVHVPYRGISPALTDLAAGRVQLVFAGAPIAVPFVRDGRFVALGLTGTRPLPTLPGVQPLADLGLAGYDVPSWYGIVAPAGTPADILGYLHREIVAVLDTEKARRQWTQWGAEPTASESPAGFSDLMRGDARKWADLVGTGKLKLQ